MRINFISTAMPLRAGKRLKRLLAIPESLALECTAFVLGYTTWHELNAQLRTQPATDLDEKVTTTVLAERRTYQLGRLTEFWASKPNPPADLAQVLAVWQPSAARPQEVASAPVLSESGLLTLLLTWQAGKGLPAVMEDELVATLQAGVGARSSIMAIDSALDALSGGHQQSFRLARRVLEVFAAENYPVVWFNLATALLQGHGGPADPSRAVALLQRFVASPNAEPADRAHAVAVLGTLQALGIGRPADPKKALAQWERGAAEGNVEAAFNAALTLMQPEAEGRKVDASTRAKAAQLYRQAAAAGHVPSMTNLGILLMKHRDLETQHAEYFLLLERATQHGDAIAAGLLAESCSSTPTR